MPPGQIDSAILARLRQLFTAEEPIGIELTLTSWFDRDVLCLAPFRTLTERVYRAFPDFPACQVTGNEPISRPNSMCVRRSGQLDRQ